jgi:hypothetical protein
MPLSDVQVRQAKPRDKACKLFDAGGLYLEVFPTGGKRWRMKYRFDGKEKCLAFGTYPDVPLAGRKRCWRVFWSDAQAVPIRRYRLNNTPEQVSLFWCTGCQNKLKRQLNHAVWARW